MKLDDFSLFCKRKFDSHFKEIEVKVKNGEVWCDGCVIKDVYYPTMILCVESEGRVFSVEFLGISRERKPLKVKKRNNISVRELTSLCRSDIEDRSAFIMTGRNTFRNIIFYDHDVYRLRDPIKYSFLNSIGVNFSFTNSMTHLVDFVGEFTSGMLSECVLAYENNGFFRARYIFEIIMTTANINNHELDVEIDYLMGVEKNSVYGVRYLSGGEDESWTKASHLLNLVLNDKIHETTIGDYLNDHPDIICKALGYESIIYEPSLKWVEKTEDNLDQYINPDALLKRSDGSYDICDFKKGLLKRKNITKGERKRRRFVDDVNEGLAQLDNYEEYFSYQENKKHAFFKYGIKTNKPKKILIIGNIENAISIEVEQALRGRENTMVIDYDLLISYYFGTVADGGDKKY
ncbi:Shedu anti-phage system protein SduA domain-containing protein [Klebsiella aerogenes]